MKISRTDNYTDKSNTETGGKDMILRTNCTEILLCCKTVIKHKIAHKCTNERQAMADGSDAHVQSASKNGVNPILTCHKVQPNKPQWWETYHLEGNNRHRKTDFNGTGLKGFQHFEIYAENINGRTEHRQRCNWTDTKETANVKFQSVQQCHYRQTAQQIGCYKETP